MHDELTTPALRPQELLDRLGDDGALHDVRAVEPGAAWFRRRELVAIVEGALDLDDRSVRVQVGLKADFPARLPVISIDPTGELAELPHIEPDGAVCYRPQDEPLLDRDNPRGIVREALALAAGTLRSVLRGDLAGEFASEIVAYWAKHHPKARTILGVVDPDDRARIITAFLDRGKLIAAADSPAAFANFRHPRNVDHLTFSNALYVPIDPAGTDSSFHPRRVASVEGLRTYVVPAIEQDRALWREIEQHCRSRELLVVLGVQRKGERRGLVGLLVRRRADGHPLDLVDPRITPVHIDPVDRGYLAPRGGADVGLAGRKVLVIGCGAVGGHAAVDLARAGVGEIHLMDPEEFEAANTFRHVCGRVYVGHRKVVGLKLEIERLLPFVSVKMHPHDVLDWMRRNPEGFRGFDLVVCAIGNPTVEMRVNAAIAADAKAPPAIFAWLEPFGLGGHVLVAHLGAEAGCFECLYARDDGALACRTAFARPGARYTRDMMGCGSQHMAYGDLDAQRTAGYVARRALEVLGGKAQGPTLLSWKGDAEAFRQAGFQTTRRFDLSAAETLIPGTAVAQSDCPVCRRP
jgi:siroheme synthase (precorrin-2 oxidase/ferrochelatase)